MLEVFPESSSTFALRLEPVPARLGVARGAGEMAGGTGEAVAWLCVEGGEGRLRVADLEADVAGRSDVFEGPAWSAVVPPGTGFAVDGSLRYTIVWRRSLREDLRARLIDPAEVVEEARGSGPAGRTVRTYIPEGPIIAGETVNQPGGWSSYPPHRHEHEEIYLYRFDPPDGFGVAVNYGPGVWSGEPPVGGLPPGEPPQREPAHGEPRLGEQPPGGDQPEAAPPADGERAMLVHDGSVQRISAGYHPVVAAPGYAMYYLWALAGESDVLAPAFDPKHAGRA